MSVVSDSEVSTSSCYLWILLMGKNQVADTDVIGDELRRNGNRILSGLNLYLTRNANADPAGTTNQDKLTEIISTKLDLERDAAWDLFCSFVMFESGFEVSTLEEFLVNRKEQKELITHLRDFYRKERTCILLCSQIVLAASYKTKHVYHTLFEYFVSSSSHVEWMKWAIYGLKLCKREWPEERVASLHLVSTLLFRYGHVEGVVECFTENMPLWTFEYNDDPIVEGAEAILFYTFALCPRAKDGCVKLLNEYLKSLVELNRFGLGVSVALSLIVDDDDPAKERLRLRLMNMNLKNLEVVKQAKELVTLYKETYTLEDCYGLTDMAFRVLFQTYETIQSKLVRQNFGTDADWLYLLSALVRKDEIGKGFLATLPEEWSELYQDALNSFPVVAEPLFDIWASLLYSTSKSEIPSMTIFNELTRLTTIAEPFDSVNPTCLRPVNNNGIWKLNWARRVGGLHLPQGTEGTLVESSSPLIISWDVVAVDNNALWDVVRYEVFRPLELLRAEELSELQKSLVTDPRVQLLLRFVDFIVQISDICNALSIETVKMFVPTSDLLAKLYAEAKDKSDKVQILAKSLQLADAGWKFEQYYFHNIFKLYWPTGFGTGECESLILGYECVSTGSAVFTRALLSSLVVFLQDNKELRAEGRVDKSSLLVPAVTFIARNIFPSFQASRSVQKESKQEITLQCLKIFHQFFQVDVHDWKPAKEEISTALLSSSCLSISDIQNSDILKSVLHQRKETSNTGEIAFYTLAVFFQSLKHYPKKIEVASFTNQVSSLCELTRHRLDGRIPTLAFQTLHYLGSDHSIPIVSCIGGPRAFRENMVSRLQMGSEDPRVKVAILDLLTLCANVQPGFLQQFISDSSIVDVLVELLQSDDGALVTSIINVVCALIPRWSSVLEGNSDLWKYITILLRDDLKNENRLVTSMLNLFIVYIHETRLKDNGFVDVLRIFTSFQQIVGLFENCTLNDFHEKGSDQSKRLLSFKHLILIMRSHGILNDFIDLETREELFQIAFNKLWLGANIEESKAFRTTYAEILYMLSPVRSGEFDNFRTFVEKMTATFRDESLSVQTPLLAVLKLHLESLTSPLANTVTQSCVRLVCQVLQHSEALFQHHDTSISLPCLGLAASVLSTIISSPHCEDWQEESRRLEASWCLIVIARKGLMETTGCAVVKQCIECLIQMAKDEQAGHTLSFSNIADSLWSALNGDLMEESMEWRSVFLLALYLNTKMVQHQGCFVLQDSFAFWSLHAPFIVNRLQSLARMCDISVDIRWRSQQLADTIHCHIVIVQSILAMAPFVPSWIVVQNREVTELAGGMFRSLSSVNELLHHPHILQQIITGSRLPATGELKLTPQFLETQTKLWSLIDVTLLCFWKMREHLDVILDLQEVNSLVQKIGNLAVRALVKPEKKAVASPAINITSTVRASLEKVFTLLIFIERRKHAYLQKYDAVKAAQIYRMVALEAVSICETARRIHPSSRILDESIEVLEFLLKVPEKSV